MQEAASIRNLETTRHEIESQMGTFEETTASAGSLGFDETSVLFGDTRLFLREQGRRSAAEFVGAPAGWLKQSLSETLQAAVFGHLYEELGPKGVTLLSRGGELVRVADDNLRLGTDEVFASVAEGIGNDADGVISQNLRFPTETSFEVDLASERFQDQVQPGDIVQGGIHLYHSIAGEEATRIEAYILRLVCMNGMTRREACDRRAPRTRRLPPTMASAREMQRGQIRRLVAETYRTLQGKLEALKPLQQEQVDVPIVLRQFLDRSRVGGRRLLGRLVTAWQEQEDGVRTAWAAVNALSYVATHATDLTPQQRRALAGLAGLLAYRATHLCPRCFSVLGS